MYITTLTDIQNWFQEGIRQNATHLLVVCDTFEYEDYPIYAWSDEDCWQKFMKYQNPNKMSVVMEVYDLRDDNEEQLTQKSPVLRLPSSS